MTEGANEFQHKLREELEKYILTQYFGKISILRKALATRIDQEGLLYRRPYIESSPAYQTVPNGIDNAKIPEWMKVMFRRLVDEKMGVYSAPFKHQIEALEAAWAGYDLFVSTGTGSGKTECFMWPLLAKLAYEAKLNRSAWDQRGVRVVVMYPMNALVSDQIGRLRRLIGDFEGKFARIFRDTCGKEVRRPQFGMYTSRTPYPGKLPDKAQDRALKKSLAKMLPGEMDEEYRNTLLREGKIPAKENLALFIEQLGNDKHVTNCEDAELITRFEMQHTVPDILITNYSMLEYMLIRSIEDNIWSKTKAWLDENPKEKLLFIIDEAHMYRGSSGGEVALLIRRMFHRLGIGRDRIQFILTTASMPSSSAVDSEYVERFAASLTASEDFSTFVYLNGSKEVLPNDNLKEIPQKAFDISKIQTINISNTTALDTLNQFWREVKAIQNPWKDLEEAGQWLYDEILHYKPFYDLAKFCRGNAVSLDELALKIFPELSKEKALNNVSILLSIVPFGRNRAGSVIFPARMHMLFKGIQGVFICTNPRCSHHHEDNGLAIGEVFLDDQYYSCPHCGSVVYEVYNDRRCGALFYHGYILSDEIKTGKPVYLWRQPGQMLINDLKEILLYIPSDNFQYKKSKGMASIHPCYLDTRSGFISFDDSWYGRPQVQRLFYSDFTAKGRPDVLTFKNCPKCEHQLSSLQFTSFRTRGNQSFYNLIKTQFSMQPSVPGKEDVLRYPNHGRKVLLFSDSRQRAAKLARDMADASDIEAFRQLFALAVQEMRKEEASQNCNIPLEKVYGYFCQQAVRKNVRMFTGEDAEKFQDDCNMASKAMLLEDTVDKKLKDAPSAFKQYLLRVLCGMYNTFYDSAMLHLEPTEKAWKLAMYTLEDNGSECSDKEVFLEIFNAWVITTCFDAMAIGNEIDDLIRKKVRRNYTPWGLVKDWKFNKKICNSLGWNASNKEMKAYRKAFQDMLELDHGVYYLNTSKLRLVLDEDEKKKWYQCRRCSGITPYALRNHCPHCGSSDIYLMTDSDYDGLKFWRYPLWQVMNDSQKTIAVIDTEEHTAQLSHKDQREDLWSQTESYEMRFQDMVSKDEMPVDILSSTTTMEVGIDIGSLVGVGLRNIPPMRENYQQRAGRAGRRGSSLSTIVTFCEDGPHDMLYFRDPAPMFRGEPRRPWIDIQSTKLLERHLALVILQEYLKQHDKTLLEISALDFFSSCYNGFNSFLARYEIPKQSILLPHLAKKSRINVKEYLTKYMALLRKHVERHPERYGREKNEKALSLLDALYEEGAIPTYSFPKNVVSMYLFNDQKRISGQIERGLDIAISEYAPGRSIVVNKQTYQIGGFYSRAGDFSNIQTLARQYIEDSNYLKKLYRCDHCGWMGLEPTKTCPFCGSKKIETSNMLKPWGFAPRNATSIENVQLEEKYSMALPPEYSTLPDNDMMHQIPQCKNLRQAIRNNQRIIMVNNGPQNKGFIVCRDCGASMPGDDSNVLRDIQRPYKTPLLKNNHCGHRYTEHVCLGYDFITDMLVLEISLNDPRINKDFTENLWLPRAAQTFAEALRITVSEALDIEYTEMVSGYRVRRNEAGVYVDVYLYDSLSSGAGYAISIADDLPNILKQMNLLLSQCSCDNACHNCLKHYRNQHIHSILDRQAAQDLWYWAVEGKIMEDVDFEEQKHLINKISYILKHDGFDLQIDSEHQRIYLSKNGKTQSIIICPGMCQMIQEDGEIYLADVKIKYARPYALQEIESYF